VYILEDQIGSSVVRLNTSGTIIDEEEYYPFGDSSLRTFTYKRYRYVGKEKDAESGLYYYGARYYSAWNCRFISIDPLAADYTYLTPYNYAGNRPIISIDIDGMQGETNEKGAEVQTMEQSSSSSTNDKNGAITSFTQTKTQITLQNGTYTIHHVEETTTYVNGREDVTKTSYDGTGKIGFEDSQTKAIVNKYFSKPAAGPTTANISLKPAANSEILPIIQGSPPAGSSQPNGGEEPSTGTQVLDAIQLAFDVIGLVPGLGEIFDGLNAAIYLARGDYANAALSAAAAIPFAGMAATGAKLLGKAADLSKATDVATTGGRLGKSTTRSQIDEIATELESRGYTITGGGGRMPEEYLRPIGGGRKGGSYPDITATHPNYGTLRINTIDVLKDGKTATAREARNAARIRTQIGDGEHLLLIPKK
jgi:RHS repeat-associated protein